MMVTQRTLYKPRFCTGQLLVATDVMEMHGAFCPDIGLFVKRHASGDWGCVPDNIRQQNENSLVHGGMLVSAFDYGACQIRVSTGEARNYTLVSITDIYAHDAC